MARTGGYEEEAFHEAGVGANRPRVQRDLQNHYDMIATLRWRLPFPEEFDAPHLSTCACLCCLFSRPVRALC